MIVGPEAPYFRGGYPMEARRRDGQPEAFIYQCRAFLDQIAGTPDPLPPNASFADGLHTMEILQAVVASAQATVLPVDVGSASTPAPSQAGAPGLPLPA